MSHLIWFAGSDYQSCAVCDCDAGHDHTEDGQFSDPFDDEEEEL